jgi:hypothetical protein
MQNIKSNAEHKKQCRTQKAMQNIKSNAEHKKQYGSINSRTDKR